MTAPRAPQPIRRYIAWALTGAVTLTVVVFAAVVISANESLEQQYHQRLMQTERSHVLRQFRDTGVRRFESALAMSYLVDAASRQPRPPDWLAAHAPGDYELEGLEERDYFVSVEDLPEGRLYIAVDNTGPEAEEQIFDLTILISALLLVALSVQLGRSLSRRLAEPLKRLAEDIEGFDVAARGQRLSPHLQTLETQRIAVVFNQYLGHLDTYIEREQNLTAMASHELRTPLVVVAGAAEVLEQRLGDDEANLRTVRRISEAGREMRDRVAAILELSRRPDAAPLPPCQADQVLRRVAERLTEAAAARGVTLGVEAVPTPLAAHPQLLEILFGNLLDNALRHAGGGAVRVALSALAFSVSDSGPGIAPSDLPRLMQPGERGAQPAGEGAGLGLYIARQICARYGWRLALDNRPEGGVQAVVNFGASR